MAITKISTALISDNSVGTDQLATNIAIAGTLGVTGVATVGGLTIGSAVITEVELEVLDGASLTTTELNYVDGVTSAIQTQLDTKATTGKAIAMALVFG